MPLVLPFIASQPDQLWNVLSREDSSFFCYYRYEIFVKEFTLSFVAKKILFFLVCFFQYHPVIKLNSLFYQAGGQGTGIEPGKSLSQIYMITFKIPLAFYCTPSTDYNGD